MAVPKKKQTRSRRDKRRANHDKMAAPTIVYCVKCAAPKAPHKVCMNCGWYKDRTVFEIQVDAPEPETDEAA
jgi:large subunit ribosomal protein L32